MKTRNAKTAPKTRKPRISKRVRSYNANACATLILAAELMSLGVNSGVATDSALAIKELGEDNPKTGVPALRRAA